MEARIMNIVRFATCMLALIIAVIAMIKADDNNAMRRLAAVLGAVLIYFNELIGAMVYLLIGSTIETLIAVSGVGLVLILAVVIMFLPLIAVFRWLVH